jgi:integrase
MARRRPSGEGSIFQDKRGFWVAKITLPDGIRREKHSKRQDVVKKWLLTARSELRDGVLPKDEHMTVSQFLTNYKDTVWKHSMRPNTLEIRSYILRKHILPIIGSIKLVGLRPDHLQSLYSKKLDEGLSKNTVLIIHQLIHKALSNAEKWGMVKRNVSDLVEAPKREKKPMSIWTPEQVLHFINTTRDHPYWVIWVLAIYTSMRRGEILGIHYEDINLSKGTVFVQYSVHSRKGGTFLSKPKTESSIRIVKIPEDALSALKIYLDHLDRKEGIIFRSSRGEFVHPSNVVRAFKHESKKAGLPKIRFHDLRHTSVALMAAAGIHAKTVQERLGHAQLSTTLDVYFHLFPSLQDEASEKLDGMLRPSSPTTSP